MARCTTTWSAAPLAMASVARMTAPGSWPIPWKPQIQRGRARSCSTSQVALTMCTPSTGAWPPLEGNSAPVVKPSIWSLLSPASAMACRHVSMASAPSGTPLRRTIGLWA